MRLRSSLWVTSALSLVVGVARAQPEQPGLDAQPTPAEPTMPEVAPPPAAEPDVAPTQAEPAAVPAANDEKAPPAPAPLVPAPVAEQGKATEVHPEAPQESDDTADPTHGHILDATGYLLPGRTVELGLFYMGYGITDWLNVGTQPAFWLLGPILGGRSGNLGIKLGLPITRWVNAGLEVNATWLSVEEEGSRTRGYIIPATLAVSVNATPAQNYSLAARYISAEGGNDSSVEAQEIEGAAIVRLAQLIAEGRYRFTDSFALYARGYFQAWEENLNVDGEADIDDETTVEVEGEASAVDSRPWAAILGAHLHWGAINLRLGVGYGNYFVPATSFSIPNKRFFPDLNFYARF